MCTLSWLIEKNGYSLVFNRDEINSRQRAIPPQNQIDEVGTKFLSPTDTDANGSWLIVNEYGLTACLLNFYMPNDVANSNTRSRGEIVLKLTSCDSISDAEQIMRQLNTEHYRGFDLMLFDGLQPPVQYHWDTHVLTRLYPDIPLTSSSYMADEIHTYRKKMIMQNRPKNLTEMLALHASHVGPSPAHSPCMHRDDAKTVSQCVVKVSDSAVVIRYADGSPCCTELSEPLTLVRELNIATAL